MYRRRCRPTSTAVLPATRRASAVEPRSLYENTNGSMRVDGRQPTVGPRTRQQTRSIGTAFISSSSESSSGSSSPTMAPVCHPPRQRPVTRSRTRDRAAFVSTGRCSGPIASGKSAFRLRRRALLRSALSPDSNATVHSPTSAASNGQSASALSRTPLDDSVQILRTELPVAPQRNLRGRNRSSRSTRRLAALSSARLPCSLSPRSQPSRNSCAELILTDEVRASLTAAAAESEGNGVATNTDDDCVICLCAKSNRSVVLPCMHTFCFDCIHRWLSTNPSCPLCKRVTQRIIHSIFSDTRFTEVLVSDLQRASSQRHHISLGSPDVPLNGFLIFDGAMQSFTNRPGSQRHHQQQHHHFHDHLGSDSPSSLPSIDYLVLQSNRIGPDHHVSVGSSNNSSEVLPLSIPSFLVPPESGSSATPLTGLLEGSHPLVYPWYMGVTSSTSESRRSLLSRLVNNGIRAQDSLLLDSLLLRQLVYILEVDSVPVTDGPLLERNISSSFLAANETHRHRLEQFIRRELRAMAPWLAYPIVSGEASSRPTRLYEERFLAFHEESPVNAAITSPLIRGAPGFLTDTRELDALTHLIVQHFTTVSMTDEGALINLLTTHPMLHPSLVPTRYLQHFTSEVLQFARYSGTLDEYDSAVCLYHRRLRSSASTNRTSDPRLAVYVASACLPRLRPGFSQPLSLLTYPLVSWLMQRLFAHFLIVRNRPTLSGPLRESEDAQSSTICHPNCLMLASLTRTLLTSLPSSSRTADSTLRYNGPSRRMRAAELWPSRLLYQRVLSELIDHARFSEAIGTQYGTNHHIPTHVTPRSTTILDSDTPSSNAVSSNSENNSGSTVDSVGSVASLPYVEPLTADSTRPVIQAHFFAIRRLHGLVFLFSDNISVLDDDVTQEDGYFGELLNTPLLPVPESRMGTAGQSRNSLTARTNSAVIDLTRSTYTSNDSHRRTFTVNRSDYQASVDSPTPVSSPNSTTNFSVSDWNFLRRLPSSTSDCSEILSPRTVRSRQHLGVPTFQLIQNHDQDEAEQGDRTTDTLDAQVVLTGSCEREQGLNNGTLTENSLPSHAGGTESGQTSVSRRTPLTENNHRWRSSLLCLTISSDSSSDEREYDNPLRCDSTSSITVINDRAHLTSDDSDDMSSLPPPVLAKTTSESVSHIPSPNLTVSNGNSADLMDQLGGVSQLLSNIEENHTETVSKMYISPPATSSLEEVSGYHSPSTKERMEVDESSDATSSMFLQRRIACRRSLMSDFLKCPTPKESFGNHPSFKQLRLSITDDVSFETRPLNNHRPRIRLPHLSGSSRRHINSPISLGDSDSEFEFLRESITLRSSSSSSSSSSPSVSSPSSCCSTSSLRISHSTRLDRVSRSRSPAPRSSEALGCWVHRAGGKRHRHHRRRRHHSGHRSRCHHSKYGHYRSSHRHHHHDHKRRCRNSKSCKDLRVNCFCSNTEKPSIIPANNASSPILISDNDEGAPSLEVVTGKADAPTTDKTKLLSNLVPSAEKTTELSTDALYVFPLTSQGDTDSLQAVGGFPASQQPSCSTGKQNFYDVTCSVKEQKDQKNDGVLPQEVEGRSAPVENTSLNAKVDSIYEPTGVGDFYHFMDRLSTLAVINSQEITIQNEVTNSVTATTASPHEDCDKERSVSPSLPAEKTAGV